MDSINKVDLRIKWMTKNGFIESKKIKGYSYKGNLWSFKKIKETRLYIIMAYKKFYDGLITRDELELLEKS